MKHKTMYFKSMKKQSICREIVYVAALHPCYVIFFLTLCKTRIPPKK